MTAHQRSGSTRCLGSSTQGPPERGTFLDHVRHNPGEPARHREAALPGRATLPYMMHPHHLIGAARSSSKRTIRPGTIPGLAARRRLLVAPATGMSRQ